MQTLEEAKQYLRKNWEKGVVCPCCTQFVHLSPRGVYAMMCVVLIEIYKWHRQHGFEKYVHVQNLIFEKHLRQNFDFTKLHWWELIEKEYGTRDDGSPRNGYWRITQKGISFVQNQLEIPAKLWMFNNKVYRTDTKNFVNIEQALKKKFSYQDLMAEFYQKEFPQEKLL